MQVAQYFERVVRAVWQHHYLIPEAAYWVVLVALGAVTIVGSAGLADIVGAGLMVLAAVGIGRWRADRRRCRGALVVPRFREGGDTEGHSDEAQRILIDQLRSNLKPEERDFVQPVAVTVSGDDIHLAEKLQQRLRAGFVLHGRLAGRPGGGWSVLPRILEPPSGAMHYDPVTRDITPSRSSFGPIISHLPAEHGVRDEEFPFEFAKDLQALARSIAGLVAAFMRDYPRAIALLEEAIAVGGDSPSALMDSLRVSLAVAHADNDEVERGLDVLRPRVYGESPSPHLLRGYAWLLARLRKPDETLDEEESVLRQALEMEGDPLRDQTVHNLMSLLDGRARSEETKDETHELLQQLLQSPSDYRKTWYVKRALGVSAWLRAIEARDEEDVDLTRAEAKDAAKWYARALRARPHLQVLHVQWRPPFVFYNRFPPSPIMRANLRDAHGLAGHPLRAAWHEWRFQRVRAKLMKRGFKQFAAEEYDSAYANFDWSIVGRHDNNEAIARVHSAVSLWMVGRKDDAEEAWTDALESNPFALIVRGGLAQHLRELGHDDPVPGTEPTELRAIKAFAPNLFTVEDESDP